MNEPDKENIKNSKLEMSIKPFTTVRQQILGKSKSVDKARKGITRINSLVPSQPLNNVALSNNFHSSKVQRPNSQIQYQYGPTTILQHLQPLYIIQRPIPQYQASSQPQPQLKTPTWQQQQTHPHPRPHPSYENTEQTFQKCDILERELIVLQKENSELLRQRNQWKNKCRELFQANQNFGKRVVQLEQQIVFKDKYIEDSKQKSKIIQQLTQTNEISKNKILQLSQKCTILTQQIDLYKHKQQSQITSPIRQFQPQPLQQLQTLQEEYRKLLIKSSSFTNERQLLQTKIRSITYKYENQYDLNKKIREQFRELEAKLQQVQQDALFGRVCRKELQQMDSLRQANKQSQYQLMKMEQLLKEKQERVYELENRRLNQIEFHQQQLRNIIGKEKQKSDILLTKQKQKYDSLISIYKQQKSQAIKSQQQTQTKYQKMIENLHNDYTNIIQKLKNDIFSLSNQKKDIESKYFLIINEKERNAGKERERQREWERDRENDRERERARERSRENQRQRNKQKDRNREMQASEELRKIQTIYLTKIQEKQKQISVLLQKLQQVKEDNKFLLQRMQQKSNTSLAPLQYQNLQSQLFSLQTSNRQLTSALQSYELDFQKLSDKVQLYQIEIQKYKNKDEVNQRKIKHYIEEIQHFEKDKNKEIQEKIKNLEETNQIKLQNKSKTLQLNSLKSKHEACVSDLKALQQKYNQIVKDLALAEKKIQKYATESQQKQEKYLKQTQNYGILMQKYEQVKGQSEIVEIQMKKIQECYRLVKQECDIYKQKVEVRGERVKQEQNRGKQSRIQSYKQILTLLSINDTNISTYNEKQALQQILKSIKSVTQSKKDIELRLSKIELQYKQLLETENATRLLAQKYQQKCLQLQRLLVRMEQAHNQKIVLVKHDYDVVYSKYLKYRNIVVNHNNGLRERSRSRDNNDKDRSRDKETLFKETVYKEREPYREKDKEREKKDKVRR